MRLKLHNHSTTYFQYRLRFRQTMLTTTISLAVHLATSSYQGVRAVGRVLGYAYSSMAQGPKIDFNTKHLKTGDPLPPFTGKLRVYNMRFCPFAQRTILALNAKKIDYEVINVDLVDKPEWIFEKSPLGGKVPSIEIKEGELIYESLITVEYLDEVYPQRPLLPKDPFKKAFDKIIVEVIGAYIHPYFFKLMKAPDAITQEQTDSFNKGLDLIQDALKSRGTTFLDGEEPGYADYMIWPWFERLTIYEDKVNIKGPKYALLAAYLEKMLQDPVVSEYLIPKEIFVKFIEAYGRGLKPDYELLNKN